MASHLKKIGIIKKMKTDGLNPVRYDFVLANIDKNTEEYISLNNFLDKEININFTGKINCIHCNRNIKKTFNQGYCFPCFKSLARCDSCIIKPEFCHFHKDTCREPEWGLKNCFIPHIVYLANSSGVKVGITRETQIPTRWRDQGAIQALPIIKVKSRYQSGLIEVEIAKHISDKTNWREMLKQDNNKIDLLAVKKEILPKISNELKNILSNFNEGDIEVLNDTEITEISYPVIEYPNKITSLNFDKNPQVKGKLLGIKGQYLILDTGVINIRKFTGYEVEFYDK